MRADLRPLVFVIGALTWPLAASAQGPMSAIDWLSDSVILPAPVAQPLPPPRSNDIATSALPEPVTVTPLGAPSPDSVGLISARRAGLPPDLWAGSSSQTLARRLSVQHVPPTPALRDLFAALLIAELDPPAASGGGDALFLARVDALLSLGALDDAAELLERAGRNDPETFRRWFDIALLRGTEDRACNRMRALPQISPTYAARIFCLARGGDWQAAALTLATAEALGLLSADEDRLLARFLLTELNDDAPPLPPARNPTPLMFSIQAAIGEPIPTATLPVAFAHADLRPVTGWKARIAAAERLARIGAVPPERLMSVYTERQPAASGGVWERVRAVQDFIAALDSADPAAVAQTLPPAWSEIESAELEVAFANAFRDALRPLDLSGSAGALKFRIGLLSPDYAEVARNRAPETPAERFWIAVALEDPQGSEPPDALSAALRDGFTAQGAPVRLQSFLDQNRTGEAVLRAIVLFGEGADGNLDELQDSIALLRAVGLGDVARRAALQLMILDRRA